MLKNALFLLLFLLCVDSFAQGTPRNGKVMTLGGSQKAWHMRSQRWLGLEDFWRAYAEDNGGLTWGRRDSYPPYEQVKEFDTMIIQTPDGICLMEFFHERWRRANDVRRWDRAFNSHSGCGTVFDH